MGKKISEMTPAERVAKNKTATIYNKKRALEKADNRTITYRIFGEDIPLPKGFTFGPGVSLSQNKTSIQEGFKKLQQWFNNPTTENWAKLFGSNNQFGYQLRAYLLDQPVGTRKGVDLTETNKKLFDTLDIKNKIGPTKIETIKDVTANLMETTGL